MKPRFLGKFKFGYPKLPPRRDYLPFVPGPDAPGDIRIDAFSTNMRAKDEPWLHFAAFERDGDVALQASNGRFLRFRDEDRIDGLKADATTLDEADWFLPELLYDEEGANDWVTADGCYLFVNRSIRAANWGLYLTPDGGKPDVSWHVERVTPPLEVLRERGSARGLDLQWLDLSGEDLRGMDLRDTRLEYARLDDACLEGAKLQGAELSHAVLAGAKLARAELVGTEIVDRDLERLDLREADLRRTVFRESRFTQCRLAGAVLHGTDFEGARFEDTDLGDRPDFGRSEETRTRFVEAALLHRMLGGDWRYLDLSRVTFTDFEPAGERVDLADLRAEHARLVRVDLTRADLSEADLRHADLTSARLDGALLERTDLANADLSRTVLRGAVCRQTVFDSARLYATNLTDLALEFCTFRDAYGGTTGEERVAFFTGSVLSQVDFANARLGGVDLTAVVMDTCTLEDAHLEEAKLGLSFLGEAKFDRAHLEGADFVGSCLVGASLCNAHLAAAGPRSTSFVDAFLHGANLSGTRLDDVNLRGAVMTFDAKDRELEVWIPLAPGEPNDKIPWRHGPTVVDPRSTGSDTLCPDGQGGPCTREDLETTDPPDCWRYDGPGAAALVEEIERRLANVKNLRDDDQELERRIGGDRRDE